MDAIFDPPQPYHIAPIRAAQAQDVVHWRYPPPFHVYNILLDDDEVQAREQIAYLLQPATHCHAITDAGGTLLAFCTFGADARVPGGDYSVPALDIGLGLRPDLTGRGLGAGVVEHVLAFAARRFGPQRLRVTVAVFNERAQKVWQRQGFAVEQRFVATAWTEEPFFILSRDTTSPASI